MIISGVFYNYLDFNYAWFTESIDYHKLNHHNLNWSGIMQHSTSPSDGQTWTCSVSVSLITRRADWQTSNSPLENGHAFSNCNLSVPRSSANINSDSEAASISLKASDFKQLAPWAARVSTNKAQRRRVEEIDGTMLMLNLSNEESPMPRS